jgi:hypothetical protein
MTALLRKPSVLLPAATTSSMSGFPDACAVASAHPGGGVSANVPDPPLSEPDAAEAVAVVLAASDPVVAEEVTLVSPPLDVGVGAGGVDEQPARARKAPNTNTENRFMATPVMSSMRTAVGRHGCPTRSQGLPSDAYLRSHSTTPSEASTTDSPAR